MSDKKTASNAGKRLPNAGSFQKGDSRINRNGSVSKKRLGFNRVLRELLIDEGETDTIITSADGTQAKIQKVKALVKVVWNQALKGEQWATNFIADRIEGKVPFNVDMDHSGSIDGTLKVEVIHLQGVDVPDSDNGNGNGNAGEAKE